MEITIKKGGVVVSSGKKTITIPNSDLDYASHIIEVAIKERDGTFEDYLLDNLGGCNEDY